jgi:hypothetical protein
MRILEVVAFAVLVACTPGTGGPGAQDSTADSADSQPDAGPEALCQLDLACPGNILDDPKAPCTVAITGGSGDVEYSGPAGFELRGRSSLVFPKPQYSMELRTYNELPVWPGSTWRYLDDGSTPGSGWKSLDFDDAAWGSGGAPLGYGEPYLTTTVRAGANEEPPAITTYFRYEFTVSSKPDITQVNLGLIRNDGAAVYLNGHEILRDNLPDGATDDTLATTPQTFEQEIVWIVTPVDPALLNAGTNVLAVEVHQAAPASPDMRFDVYLEGTGDDVDVDLLGMGAEADWVVNGMYVDRSLFRNRLAFDLFQSFGGKSRFATETRFCELQLNGQYEGIYSLGEKIDDGKDRVDISPGTEPGQAFIIKSDDAIGFRKNHVGYGNWQLVWPDEADDATYAEIGETLDQWEAAVRGPPATSPDDGMFAYLDVDSAVDFVLLQEFMKNVDAYALSIYLWKDHDGKMHFSPWDLDLSMGYPYTDCGAEGWILKAEFVQAMAASPVFHDRLVARWRDLRQNQLAEEAILARIDDYDTTLEPGLPQDLARWPVTDIAFSTDYVDNWLCPVSSYEDEHARTLRFIHDRLTWMDANIESF